MMKAKDVNKIEGWFKMTGWKKDLLSVGISFLMVILAAGLLAACIILIICVAG